jgi:hypothetical protein
MDLEEAIEHFSFKDEGMCNLAVIMQDLTDKDKKVLNDALAKGIPSTTIASALRSEGHKIGEPTINLHRRDKCRCTR